MSTKYVDLGAGIFLTDGSNSLELDVCDANSAKPDVFYGPEAWHGGVGPASSRRLLFIESVAAADFIAACIAYDCTDVETYPPTPEFWPAKATVLAAGKVAGIGAIDQKTFGSEEELCTAIREITKHMPRTVWTGTSSSSRLEAAMFRYSSHSAGADGKFLH